MTDVTIDRLERAGTVAGMIRAAIGAPRNLQQSCSVTTPSRSRPIPRRGLSRVEAAMYLGISPSKFDELVKDGRAPHPRLIDSRKVWDIIELDLTFDELPREDSLPITNSWADR